MSYEYADPKDSIEQDERDADLERQRELDESHSDGEKLARGDGDGLEQESLIMELEEKRQAVDHLTYSIEQDEKMLAKDKERIKKIEELLSAPNF